VCTTELGYMANLAPEFTKRNCQVIGLSLDPVTSHLNWSKDIADVMGTAPNYPIIADTDLKVSKLYGMIPAETPGTSEGRTAADNATVRNVFVIGPDKMVKLIIVYPMSTGRNFDEVLRVIDSLQLTAKHKVATPVNWKHGEDVIIVPALSDADAKMQFPTGWKTVKPYMRVVAQPMN
jgi:thioredoxin-dependent peroxiredoxin